MCHLFLSRDPIWDRDPDFGTEDLEKLGTNAMKRVAAGAHLPTPWIFEPAKRPDDRADYCWIPDDRADYCLGTRRQSRLLPGHQTIEPTGPPSSADLFPYLMENHLAPVRFEPGISNLVIFALTKWELFSLFHICFDFFRCSPETSTVERHYYSIASSTRDRFSRYTSNFKLAHAHRSLVYLCNFAFLHRRNSSLLLSGLKFM